jgi:hypothetical protein
LKKRTKKLLSPAVRDLPGVSGLRGQSRKSFLLLFFKKEALASAGRRARPAVV